MFATRSNLLALAVFSVVASSTALAADAQESKVSFTLEASMASLRDPALHDQFKVALADAKIATQLHLECQAGVTKALVLRTDEACSVQGNGSIVNPQNASQKLLRTQYAGGFTEKKDGTTQAGTLKVNYLAVGKVPASETSFQGSVTLKPENPSMEAAALSKLLLDKLTQQIQAKGTPGSVMDERVDTIKLSNLLIPSAGLPSENGCAWNGSMVYAYQTQSWFMDVTAACGAQSYHLKGNMPWIKAATPGHTEYHLTLTVPGADTKSDDALFASSADSDLFATADGISGDIIIKESQYIKTMVDGKPENVASQLNAQGQLVGKNVSLEAVRSLSTLIGLLSRTFFGA